MAIKLDLKGKVPQLSPIETPTPFKAASAIKEAFISLSNILLYPLDRILRVPVYRLALNDRFSNIIKKIFFFFAQCGSRFREFNLKRADASLQRLAHLGAQIEFLDMQSQGGGQILAMRFTADALEAKIKSAGGTWRQDGVVEGPASDPQWLNFAKQLTSLRWEVQVNSNDQWETIPPQANGKVDLDAINSPFRFITCTAPLPAKAPKEILFNHTTTSALTGYWKLFGYILGAKQNITTYDSGNTYRNSGRPISEQSFYDETEAVYQWLVNQRRTSESNIWVWGNCGAGPNAAYLKLKHPHVNLILAKTFAALTDFGPLAKCPSWLASRLIRTVGGVYDWSLSKMAQQAQSNPRSGASINIIGIGDTHISAAASQKVSDTIQPWFQRNYTLQSQARAGKDPHDDDFYNDPIAASQFLHLLFS